MLVKKKIISKTFLRKCLTLSYIKELYDGKNTILQLLLENNFMKELENILKNKRLSKRLLENVNDKKEILIFSLIDKKDNDLVYHYSDILTYEYHLNLNICNKNGENIIMYMLKNKLYLSLDVIKNNKNSINFKKLNKNGEDYMMLLIKNCKMSNFKSIDNYCERKNEGEESTSTNLLKYDYILKDYAYYMNREENIIEFFMMIKEESIEFNLFRKNIFGKNTLYYIIENELFETLNYLLNDNYFIDLSINKELYFEENIMNSSIIELLLINKREKFLIKYFKINPDMINRQIKNQTLLFLSSKYNLSNLIKIIVHSEYSKEMINNLSIENNYFNYLKDLTIDEDFLNAIEIIFDKLDRMNQKYLFEINRIYVQNNVNNTIRNDLFFNINFKLDFLKNNICEELYIKIMFNSDKSLIKIIKNIFKNNFANIPIENQKYILNKLFTDLTNYRYEDSLLILINNYYYLIKPTLNNIILKAVEYNLHRFITYIFEFRLNEVNYQIFNEYLKKTGNLFLKKKLSEYLVNKYSFLKLGDKLTKELVDTTLFSNV